MNAEDCFRFDESDEMLHTPGSEPTWNESMAFATVEAHGPSLFIRLGRRYNEKHVEVTVAQLNQNGSLDVAFAKRPLDSKVIENPKVSSGGGLVFTQLEPMKRWRLTYQGKIKTIPHFRSFSENASYALANAQVGEGAFDLEFEDRAPLFAPGANGNVAGDSKHLSARHYESTGYCKGDFTLNGTTRRVDTFGFRDHSWGTRDMTRVEYTRWFWVQVDDTTSCVGWFTRSEGIDYSAGIILRNGKGEAATNARLKSTYDPGGERYIRLSHLELDSPNGNIVVDLEPVCALPLHYTKEGRTTRVIEFAGRIKGTARPAWIEYCDSMIDGVPAGNARA